MLRLSLNRLATPVALRHLGISYEDSDDSAVLKARYKELVRRHHRDAGRRRAHDARHHNFFPSSDGGSRRETATERGRNNPEEREG